MRQATSACAVAPVIITLAPVDYGHTEDFPSATALAKDICACHAAGASVVHFHVTDTSGRATSDTAFFDEVVARVRAACDIVIQGSTGGVGVPWEVRTAALTAPGLEMASLNMGSCNLFGRAYLNTPEDIKAVASRMNDLGVAPDMCFFEPGFFTSLEMLEEAGLLRKPPVASLCLGFPGALPATVENLVFMKSKLPSAAEWTLVHHGAPDFAILAAAMAAGGNIRVGFEDSACLSSGQRARANLQLVEKARDLVQQLGRQVATPGETRQRYGLAAGPPQSTRTASPPPAGTL